MERELKTVLGYDVEALKKNIKKHRNNVKIFTDAAEKEKEKIILLQRYIDMIEEHDRRRGEEGYIDDLLERWKEFK